MKNLQDAAPTSSLVDPVTTTEQQDLCPESRDSQPENESVPAKTQAENQVPDEKECLSADIVARIPEAYHFNGWKNEIFSTYEFSNSKFLLVFSSVIFPALSISFFLLWFSRHGRLPACPCCSC